MTNIDEALKPLFHLYSKTPAAAFSPLKLKAVREAMIADDQSEEPTSTGTSPGVHGMPVQMGGGKRNPFPLRRSTELLAVSGLRFGRSGAREGEAVKPVGLAHVQTVMPFLSAQVQAMVKLQLITGMRPGEVVIMRGMDIDTAGNLWMFKPARHKTQSQGHEPQRIPQTPKPQYIIRPFQKPELQAFPVLSCRR